MLRAFGTTLRVVYLLLGGLQNSAGLIGEISLFGMSFLFLAVLYFTSRSPVLLQ